MRPDTKRMCGPVTWQSHWRHIPGGAVNYSRSENFFQTLLEYPPLRHWQRYITVNAAQLTHSHSRTQTLTLQRPSFHLWFLNISQRLGRIFLKIRNENWRMAKVPSCLEQNNRMLAKDHGTPEQLNTNTHPFVLHTLSYYRRDFSRKSAQKCWVLI